MSHGPELRLRIKELIVESLRFDGMDPASIEDDAPLMGEGLGLDSVDALELMVALEKEFGVKLENAEVGRAVLKSVSTLAAFIAERRAAVGKPGEA
ncbi:MAG TPA: phosphopantetheine-binding protein [Candidatus Polarisedimenticolaceae bacterium]